MGNISELCFVKDYTTGIIVLLVFFLPFTSLNILRY